MVIFFQSAKKKKKSPLTTGRIPPDLKQSENQAKNRNQKAHCAH